MLIVTHLRGVARRVPMPSNSLIVVTHDRHVLLAPIGDNMQVRPSHGTRGIVPVRAAPLLRVKVKFTVKKAICMSLPLAAYGEFDCDFDFDSQEWSCSQEWRARPQTDSMVSSLIALKTPQEAPI